MTWLACFNEVLSELLIYRHHFTLINNNIYVLLESILLADFFRRTGSFRQYPKQFYFLISIFFTFWISENFIFGTISQVSKYYRIFYSAIIIILSINLINRLILSYRKRLQYHVDFILCCAFITYFTFKFLIHAFLIYGLYSSKSFVINIYNIMTWINLVVNLLYAVATLWMPKRLIFTLSL